MKHKIKQALHGRIFKIPLLLLCMVFVGHISAQTVSGKVTDAGTGDPLIGASVRENGTSNGATTDANGTYRLNVSSANATLSVSYTGYQTKSVPLAGSATADVMLEAGTALNEVVVTALGIKRDKKALAYSAQDVVGSAIATAKEPNLLSNLSGRVAGVQLYKGSGGPGGSTRIVIRGNNSLGGNNQPLIVVDGVPMDNYQTSNSNNEYGSFDRGSGISDLNPDDIESVSVLKGPAAAALYGTRGGNGVLLVTTKSGANKRGLGVTVTSSLTAEAPLLYPNVQNRYGQGANGVFDATGLGSWGPEMTGQQVTDWTGKTVALSPHPNDLKDFLQTGITATNSIGLSGGNEKSSFRFSYTNFDNKGNLPTSTLKRNLATLRVGHKLNSKLNFDSKISYTNQSAYNRPQTSGSPDNVFWQYATMPRSINMADMDPAADANGNLRIWSNKSNVLQNPYWTINKNYNQDQSHRLLTMLSLEYQLTDWLKAKVRHGMDQRFVTQEDVKAFGTLWNSSVNGGNYSAGKDDARETNLDGFLTAEKTFRDLYVSLSVGANQQKTRFQSVTGSTNGLDVPGVYNLGSGNNPRPASYFAQTQLNSVYEFLNIGWKNWLYADITYRTDWSSTLGKNNRQFSYPSFGGSWILSDMLQDMDMKLPSAITFLKLRGAYAEAGNTIGAYQLQPIYGISRGFQNAINSSVPSILLNENILPEIIKSTEVGADLRFWNNRIGLDFTWYKKNAYNQILYAPTPAASGYNFRVINAGNVENKGIEFTLNLAPLRTENGLNWDIFVNFNKNTNRVLELSPEVQTYLLQGDANSRAVRVAANAKETTDVNMDGIIDDGLYGNLYGRDFKRSPDGQIIVGADGVPLKSENKNMLLGNYQPDFLMGIGNQFNYKGWGLSFLFDIRQGGIIYSQSLASMHGAGTAKGTEANREGGLVVDGVVETSNSDGTKTYTRNTTSIKSEEYWSAVAGVEPVASLFTYDASNVRLRELVLGYSVPNKVWGAKEYVRNMQISLVGRNLWLNTKVPGVDPESTFSTTNSQGVEHAAYPSIRSIGVNLKFDF